MEMSPERHAGRIRRVVVVVPSAFTLANLFFGFWSIVSAFNGNFRQAGWFIIYAAVLDMLDGRVARMSNTGSRFGAELDSLVDVISFGVAPALLMYFLEFSSTGRFGWVVCYLFVVAAALRLARYNVLASVKTSPPGWFVGMPSPAAGMTLAAYYPFSQTRFFAAYLADLPWQQIMAVGMVLLSVLMVSHVPYAKVPKIGLRTRKGIANTVFVLGALFAALTVPRYYFFLSLLLYITWGLVKSVLLGLLDRLPGGDPLLDEDEDDDDDGRAEVRSVDYRDLGPRGVTTFPSDHDDNLEDRA
jgi:CDP-diacylglycerol--serine O-phosphatidyltransferase